MCIVFYAYIPLLHHLKFKGVRQGLGGAKTPFATPQKCLWLCTRGHQFKLYKPSCTRDACHHILAIVTLSHCQCHDTV